MVTELLKFQRDSFKIIWFSKTRIQIYLIMRDTFIFSFKNIDAIIKVVYTFWRITCELHVNVTCTQTFNMYPRTHPFLTSQHLFNLWNTNQQELSFPFLYGHGLGQGCFKKPSLMDIQTASVHRPIHILISFLMCTQ